MSTRVVIAARCISIQVMSNSVAMNACWNRNRLPKKTSVKPISMIKASADGRREVNSETYPCGREATAISQCANGGL